MWLADGGCGSALLEVSDDGVGMEEQALARLNASLRSGAEAGDQHLGLANVHKRLQYFFGEEFGLSISSRQGAGTSVRLRIPRARRKE